MFFVLISPTLVFRFWNYFAPCTKLYNILVSSGSEYIFFSCFLFMISEESAKSTFS